MKISTLPIDDTPLPGALAAIVYAPGQGVDALMAKLAARLAASGHRLAGLVQQDRGTCEGPDFSMALHDLASGQSIPISLPQTPAPHACRLDHAGLAQGGALFTASLSENVDLVILNKFGRQEALGRGLRDEIAAAVMAGCPVVIAVRADLVEAFRAFVGDDWVPLAPELDGVEAWCRAQLARAQVAGSQVSGALT